MSKWTIAPVRARKIGPGEHFGERELLQKTTRQFDATALESTTLLALNKTTFEALTKNSLTLGYFLNRSSVKYLTLAGAEGDRRSSLSDLFARSVSRILCVAIQSCFGEPIRSVPL